VVRGAEGRKAGRPEGRKVGRSEGQKVGRPEGRKVGRSIGRAIAGSIASSRSRSFPPRSRRFPSSARGSSAKRAPPRRSIIPTSARFTTSATNTTPRAGAKLLDFGLAKNVRPAGLSPGEADGETSSETLPLTSRGTVLDTFNYMAPER
jgi:hypothetical protein